MTIQTKNANSYRPAVLEDPPRIDIYLNPHGSIVMKQNNKEMFGEKFGDRFPDEYIVFPPKWSKQIIKSIKKQTKIIESEKSIIKRILNYFRL